MATRYGRRASDGTFEYHSDRGSLVAAVERERSKERAFLFGLVGLFIGGFIAYGFVRTHGVQTWSKWGKFVCIMGSAGLGAYVFAKLADLIWNLILVALLVGIVVGIGAIIWRSL